MTSLDMFNPGSAVISECGTYRYRLERDLGRDGPTMAFIMVNPSTADASQDDPTIRKVIGFANHLPAGRVIVGNKFAFRATDVRALRAAKDPVGPENDEHLRAIMREADLHIVAWGSASKLPWNLRDRWRTVHRIAGEIGCTLFCLGTADDGHPRHPLMLPYSSQLAPWGALS